MGYLAMAMALSALEADTNLPARGESAARPFTVAVVQDGDSYLLNTLIEQIEKELAELLGRDRRVVFKRSPDYSADWQVTRIRQCLTGALQEPGVDLVLAAGLLVTREAAKPDLPLAKPVVSAFVSDTELMALPYAAEGRSGKRQLNFTVVPLSLERDLAMLCRLVACKNVALLADALIVEQSGSFNEYLRRIEKELKVVIKTVSMERSAAEALSRIGSDADAVYLTPGLRMPPAEWQKLIEGLNRIKKPSFSLLGREDVERGALAALMPPARDRVARRLALNIREIMDGSVPESLPVFLAVDDSLVINALTAQQIGYHPTIDIMLQAEFLHEDQLEPGARLTLPEAVRTAAKYNVELAMKKAEVEAVRQERNIALSPLLPQLDGNGQYYQMDKDRAELSMGTQPENKTTAGLTASQVIFNDGILSRYRAAGRVVIGAQDEQEALRLDIVESAAKSYLAFLQTLALLRIEADNFDRTRNYLSLARLRHKVGAAGPEEIYRWESEQAMRKASLIRASSETEKAQIHINQVMGEDQSKRWLPQDIEIKDDDYYFLDDRFKNLLADAKQLQRFEQFSVSLAIRNSPALAGMDQKIQAMEIQLAQARRRFVVPELAASFSYDRIIDQKRIGELPIPGDEDITDENEWLVGAKATLPLFTGGERIYAVRRLVAQLQQVREAREQVRQLTEQRSRMVMKSLESSYPNIRLQRLASSRAQANLDVIRQKYSTGSVSILALLDAQNDAFVAQQGAAAAVYRYLGDVIEYQRTISWFEMEKADAEKEAWIKNLGACLKP